MNSFFSCYLYSLVWLILVEASKALLATGSGFALMTDFTFYSVRL